ncbi:hypothetical protein MPER_06386 [Moniliophthora perniciosa FA553]|nr:hypothetical protein MPER_06386 [Moniliophthora perniciosa FA553]
MSLSSPRVAVQVLGFLMLVGTVKSLYETSFTEAEFKLVFGVALKYLQLHNRDLRPATHTTIMSYE